MPYKDQADKRIWRKYNREKQKEYTARYLKKNPDKKKSWYRENRTEVLEKQRMRRRRNGALERPKYLSQHERNSVSRLRAAQARLDAIDHLGGVCAHCGNADERVLQFDHIVATAHSNSGSVTNRTKDNIREIVSLAIAGVSASLKFQLLCANCHAIKTRDDMAAFWEARRQDDPQLSLFT